MDDAVFAFPGEALVGHFFEVGAVNADLREGSRQAQRFAEEAGQFPDALFGCLFQGFLWLDAHDIDGKAGQTGSSFLIQHMGQESRGEDCKAQAVGDAVESGKLMLHGVAGPGDGMAAFDEIIDGPGGIPEQVRPGFLTFGIFHGHGSVLDDAPHHAFHEFLHGIKGFFLLQVDLEKVGQDICRSAGGLVSVRRVGVFRTEEGNGRAERFCCPAAFFPGVPIGDDGAAVHFRAGRGQGGHGDDGERFPDLRSALDQVPRIILIGNAAGDGLGRIEDASAAYSQDQVDGGSPAEADSLADQPDIGVGGYAGQFIAGKAGLFDFVENDRINSVFLDGAGAVNQKHSPASSGQLFMEMKEHAVSEIDFGAVLKNKRRHHFLPPEKKPAGKDRPVRYLQ